MPAIISFIGRPDCGKTTLIEKLIPELNRRGYKIGIIKHHIHDFEFDNPGKDTWRHKKAGAHCVALSSPTGIGLVRDTDHDPRVDKLAERYFHDVDLVITEGYKQLGFPKIEVFRRSAHDTPLDNRDETWVAFATDHEIDSDLPCFGLGDISEISDFLVEKFIANKRSPRTTLLVDGRVIPLNAFVETFIRQAILGMTTSLKGCRAPETITISVDNGRDRQA